MPKIYIIGPVGSGKTTLAKRLSHELKTAYYELDNVVWEYHPNGDTKRSEEEIQKIFCEILENDNWIIENVGKSLFDKGFDEADTIIYLNISKSVLYIRVLIRWIKQNLGMELARYKPDLNMLRQMFLWIKDNQKSSKLNKLKNYEKKLIILNERTMNKYRYK